MKAIFLILLCSTLFASEPPYKVSESQQAEAVVREIESGRMAEKADAALDRMIRLAGAKLRREGHPFEAARIEREWRNEWKGRLVTMRDLGDYAPLSQWLADWYQRLVDLLGEEVCKALHLDDINIMNFAIPVVFRPCNPQWDIVEYQKHFVPFAGVLAYWTTWAVCSGVTAGLATLLVCGPLGMAAEYLMVTRLAPGLSDRIWRASCGEALIHPIWKQDYHLYSVDLSNRQLGKWCY